MQDIGLRLVMVSLLLASLFQLPADAGEQQRPILAVFRIEDRTGILKAGMINSMTTYLRHALGEAGRFSVVPPRALRKAIQNKKKESFRFRFDQSRRIALGRELAAGKIVTASVLKTGGNCIVSAAMYDLQRMATDVSTNAEGACSEKGLYASVRKVAARMRAFGIPDRSRGKTQPPGRLARIVVRFSSEPPGASVHVDKRLVCKATPCSARLRQGEHRISMQAEGYRTHLDRLEVSDGALIGWKLQKSAGKLTVRSRPAGLDVWLNGQPVGKTDIVKRIVTAGDFQVKVSGPCHHPVTRTVRVENKRLEQLTLAPTEKQGRLKVLARDETGRKLKAGIFVDGKKLGLSPGVFTIGVCAKDLEVVAKGYDSIRSRLEIHEGQLTSLQMDFTGKSGMKMAFVPPGSFLLGCSPQDKLCSHDEMPGRRVHLGGFRIDKTEVTVAQYTRCVAAGACQEPKTGPQFNAGLAGRLDHPVNGVSWQQARDFCRWAGKRLPTEAEWEKAARGGSTRMYPWGDQEASCEYAVMEDGKTGCGQDRSWPVCSRPDGVSPYDLCDMAGNVWEWVSDWYAADAYTQSSRPNPQGPGSGTERVIRGGGWCDKTDSLRTSSRSRFHPLNRGYLIGFRCARSAH